MRKAVLLFLIAIMAQPLVAQESYTPTEENLKAREWFQDAKFGLFIHWGVYSILGDGEWVMQQQKIPVNRYELLPTFFNPQGFDAKEIVTMAKDAGMKYITITTKHHDGFAIYDSQVSDYNVVDDTPYGKDVIRMLEQECKKAGIKLFAYYSQLDWHNTDYYPRGETGHDLGRPQSGNWQNYLEYENAQIKELAENYDIAGFWFDGFWDQYNRKKEGKSSEDFNLEKTYNIIHGVNSALLIGNNHHLAPIDGEDFQMFEKDLPGKNTTGFSEDSQIGNLPLETCETINNSWGFNLKDDSHKSVKDLIQYVIKAAGNNANFLLNVGPMPNGKIQQEHKERLKAVGSWLKTNGETIYGTRGGNFKNENLVSTQKDNKLYVHILNPELTSVEIPDFNNKIKNIVYFKNKKEVKHELKKGKLTFNLKPESDDSIDTIIEITLK